MAKILLIETATDICSTAIAVDKEIVALHEKQTTSTAAVLNLQIEACVQDSGIHLSEVDAVAVSAGPGGYTSLRVGVSTAKGICFALEKPLITIDTLQALAWGSRDWLQKNAKFVLRERPIFVPMIDARRMEVVFGQFFENLSCHTPVSQKIIDNEMFEIKWLQKNFWDKQVCPFFSGNGSPKFRNVLNKTENVIFEIENCSAAFLSSLAEEKFQIADFQSIAYTEPTYMKPPNITSARNT